MAHERPERDNHAGLAIVAALQSDPSGRTVHTGSNPLVPLLNGSFDMLRAARAADAAFKQWDAAYAVDVAAAEAAVAPVVEPVKVPAHERRTAILAALKLVDEELVAEIEAQEARAAEALAGKPNVPEASAPPDEAPAKTGDASELI